jgi:hypothetical protein
MTDASYEAGGPLIVIDTRRERRSVPRGVPSRQRDQPDKPRPCSGGASVAMSRRPGRLRLPIDGAVWRRRAD